MDDKLKLLLEKIKFPSDDITYFNNGVLNKIIGNKNKSSYLFNISLEKALPFDVYQNFSLLLKKEFSTYENIKTTFTLNQIDNDKIMEYVTNFITLYSKESPLLEIFLDNRLSYDNLIIVKVINKAEEIKFKSIEKKLMTDLSNVGFKDLDVDYQVDKELKKKIEEDLKDIDAKVIIKKESAPKSEALKGNPISSKPINIKEVLVEENNVTIFAKIFGLEIREVTRFYLFSLKLTDYDDSIYANIFIKKEDKEEYNKLKKGLKEGSWYYFKGNIKNDTYKKELTLSINDIMTSNKKEEQIKDEAEIKRVELHTHTFMSQMDGLIEPSKLIKDVANMGYKAIALTDHNSVQSFPDVFHAIKDINSSLKEGETPFKAIYGTELTLVDDVINIVIRANDGSLNQPYVVFDFETTGFNAGGDDSIIEVGAVLINDGKITDRFSKLINPHKKLSPKITEITGITDEILKDGEEEETVIKEFIDWFNDYPMVAHNASFDVSFLERAYSKYKLGTYKNTVIDTLELSKALDSSYAKHSLSAITKRYDITFDEESHHRAVYDAEATALVFNKMIQKLISINYEKLSDLNNLISKKDIYKMGQTYHINLLAQNLIGLKNLFKIISIANTNNFYKTARILRSELIALREGLLVGSGCANSEVFIEATSKSDQELINIIDFYDYIEVQPKDIYNYLIQTGEIKDDNELEQLLKKIISYTKEAGKIIVATGDVHHFKKEDKIYREIIINQKVPGGGLHYLAKKDITVIPSCHYRTTNEMLNDFNFLDPDLAYELVVTNSNKIADMIDTFDVIPQTKGVPFSPRITNSKEIVEQIVYEKASQIYGNPLPEEVDARLKQELKGIIKGGFDVIYLIAQKLVKKSNDDGYFVGSRGSVGSSLVATMLGITEVNPLPAHYICHQCQTSIFSQDNIPLSKDYSSGYDLPDLICPKCGAKLFKEGQDIPFATFLGFDADKVPDIDLNFSGDYQWKAHEYTKELFGIDNVYRAGTIGTVADKTAFGFVKGYCEDKGIMKRNAEIERLAVGCTGVKRTTGQHPGGIVVIPDYKEVFDFTPYQYPADDVKSLWRTTHFDYHAIDECVLKLDILGHDDPTILKKLLDYSKMKIEDIPLDDKDVMSLFTSPAVLGVTSEEIKCNTGTLGVPEVGTKFVIGMLEETKPSTFAELVKVSGLSHGTDVWLNNAQELIKNKIVPFKEVIGCRDDIMIYLIQKGLDPLKAFKTMEFVRKGKASKDPEGWLNHKKVMQDANIPEWYITSCERIKYMFPKAHATAYIISALRIAYFKVHYPIYYYAAYFSVRCFDFALEAMIKGYNAIRTEIENIEKKGYEATNKENNIYEVLLIALEASARKIKFAPIDINKSDAKDFIPLDDNTLLPPFRALDGLGDVVAQKIVEERNDHPFISIEDLQKRGKISSTLIDKMRLMGILDDMDESSQLTLF